MESKIAANQESPTEELKLIGTLTDQSMVMKSPTRTATTPSLA